LESQTWRNQDERRYELERDVAIRVLKELSAQLPLVTYQGASPTTLVATLYFDTPDQYYLKRAKKGGKVSSIKVRAREYIPVSDDAERRVLDNARHCYLERKERTGTIRDKDRVRIDKDDLAPIIEHMIEVPGGADILRDEIRNHSLTPAMISMYERRVWGSDNDLRITLDERIRYYRAPQRVYNGLSAMQPSELGTPSAAGPKRILEVKHAAGEALPPWLATLLAELPEATGFSKFLDGMKKLEQHQREAMNLTRPLYKLP
jgi:hypothetical protein